MLTKGIPASDAQSLKVISIWEMTLAPNLTVVRGHAGSSRPCRRFVGPGDIFAVIFMKARQVAASLACIEGGILVYARLCLILHESQNIEST